MKKFIYFLFVVICVAAPFALVSCSDDDDEGGGTSAGSLDYLEVTLDGKTYMEDIPAWGYVYLDGTETDSKATGFLLSMWLLTVSVISMVFLFCPALPIIQ